MTETDANFEKFINYICLATNNISNFNLLTTCVGNGNDAGIDGIAIAINNRYVLDMGDINDILDKGMELNVELFLFKQKPQKVLNAKKYHLLLTGFWICSGQNMK